MSRRTRGPRRARSVDLGRYRDVIPEWDRFQAAASRPEPVVFRVRSGRIAEAELIGRLEARGFALRALEGLPGFFRVEDGPGPVSLTVEHWLGLIYLQQASTGVAAPALGTHPGARVLDLCSSPGGKAAHLAELMEDTGCLVANEIDERRIRGLLGNVYRLGHTNMAVIAADGRHFPEGARFERVLVDAPCSGEGTLRRRSGEAPNQSSSFLEYVTRAQRALLRRAIRLTEPGGVVLYVTCTFAPEENEAVVSDILGDEPVEVEPLVLPVPHARGLTSFEGVAFDPRVEGAARLYPHHLDSGGLFMARLRRLDGEASSDAWAPVPRSFPTGPDDREADAPDVAQAVAEVEERYAIESGTEWRWMLRGGRVWLHSVAEWPVGGWEEGPWRPVSLGLRAIEFDSRGRPRPTNDLLRLAATRGDGVSIDVSTTELRELLAGGRVPTAHERRGPVPFAHEGDVLGRGVVTAEGLVSEIPKARKADLRRTLG